MAEKLKDILFTPEKVRAFAVALAEIHAGFPVENFVASVCDEQWPQRELKEKMRHTTLCLHAFLPADFTEATKVLLDVVPKVAGFEAMVLPDYVEVFGQDHWDIALPALGELTKCGSSEFAIRPFLNKDLQATMAFMTRWADHEDYRVRRFASEGCRPRLPWAAGVPALKKDPSLVLPILEKLKDDPEEFVRKSVANNLNDISKEHPGLVLETCERWQGNSKNTDRVIKHACRTLLKQGNKRALSLFGFASPDSMRVENLALTNDSPAIGDDIRFSFELMLETRRKEKVRLEYIVHFVKANGKLSPKVFQIKEVEMRPGTHSVRKKHSFKDMSTRKHYPGIHKIEIVVNGEVKAAAGINLR